MDKNIKIRRVSVEVKKDTIEFDEKYVVDSNGEEIFDRSIEIDNDIRLYDIYKTNHNLLTSSDIKRIREMYDMTQKDYALALGVGSITIHRFEKGSIQTDSVDAILRFSENPDNMYKLLLKNKDNFTDDEFTKLVFNVLEVRAMMSHALCDIDSISKDLEFKKSDVNTISDYIINTYNSNIDNDIIFNDIDKSTLYISPLKLQKLLYYVQGICLKVFSCVAFDEPIKAWSYGPVVESIYKKYKNVNNISSTGFSKKISLGLKDAIDAVIISYGDIEATKLISLTHSEEPYINTEINHEINIDQINEYFNKIY